MIKRSVIKGIPYKKTIKYVKKELKTKSKLLRHLCGFLTFTLWIQNEKKIPIEMCVSQLGKSGLYNKISILISSESWTISMKKWLNNEIDFGEIEQLITNSILINENELQMISKKLLSLIIAFFFKDETSLLKKIATQDSYLNGVEHTKKYLLLHQQIFDEVKESFPMSLNEIMVFLNLAVDVFYE